ncbi:low molecular weight protein-tyrosine-phosphatase [Allomuricauda sp. SCSIO 65647]|uniref:low molecular weight protein-tyrosine-phosphatase n=1 Tax=Allomuricauda sp. SCSIO 65647 TaxID=2908843 RepID=UPI001F48C2F6|nr:low molecular weight protein-tyrosine-phosphatase [Muricauda sp. SCSIO 65647]UJH67620.1 low molecular weight phosphotyrosine protein phosphatase [Muricauda sp. SCSIO 65647]
MTKILMVCLGNICRSPLAEGILKSKVDRSKVFVDSAGTGGYHVGEPPDKRSIEAAMSRGIDISGQRCRKFSKVDFRDFDLIFAMDRNNYHDILKQAETEEDRQKVHLLLDLIDIGVQEVPDPYYGGKRGFEDVYGMIDQACTALIAKLN